MKTKTPLFFIELLVMILVFALAAAWCTRAFVQAGQAFDGVLIRDGAVIVSSNTAVVIKAYGGDFEHAAEICGGVWDGKELMIHYDEKWNEVSDNGVFTLRAVYVQSEAGYLGAAQITVTDSDGKCIYSLPVSWQKEICDETK